MDAGSAVKYLYGEEPVEVLGTDISNPNVRHIRFVEGPRKGRVMAVFEQDVREERACTSSQN